MNLEEIKAHIACLPDVSLAENFGYVFFFYASDQLLPFATLAIADNEYDRFSNLDREGIFRLNLGIARESFKALFPQPAADWDHSALNQFTPHPQYAAQHFICILNPSGEHLAQTLQFIEEAHALAKRRFEKKQKG